MKKWIVFIYFLITIKTWYYFYRFYFSFKLIKSILSTGTFYPTILCYFCLHRFPVVFFLLFFIYRLLLYFAALYSPSPFLPFSLCYPLLYFGAFFCFFCYLFLILSWFLFPSHSYSCFLHYSLFFAIPIPVSFSSFYISSLIHYLPFTLSPFSSLTFPLQYTVYKPFLSLPASCMAGYEWCRTIGCTPSHTPWYTYHLSRCLLTILPLRS